MERIPELKSLPVHLSSASVIVGNKVISAREQLSRSKGRDAQDLDFPVPTRPWKGKISLQEQDDLMLDVITSNHSVDSVDDGVGSSSFSGASHPPEPVDTDLMRPVYVPISQKKSDAVSLVKSMSVKGPFIDDLSIQAPPKKPIPAALSPTDSLAEEPNDLNTISSPFLVPRASQNTEASLPPDTDEKECVWDASLPPSPLSSVDSCVVRSMSIANSCASTYRSDGITSDGMLSFERNCESTKCSIRGGDSLESAKTSMSRASDSSGLSDDSNWSNLTGSANKPHKGNDPRWKAILAIRARDGILGMSHFRLLKRLGCGDIGSVYLSELSGTRCYFAMKVMDKLIPNGFTVSCLIDGLCKDGRLNDASNFFLKGTISAHCEGTQNQCEKRTSPFNHVAYTALIQGLCKEGRVLRASKFFSDMRNLGLKADVITYMIIIMGHARALHVQNLLMLQADMFKLGFLPDTIIYPILHKAYQEIGDVKSALKCFEDILGLGAAWSKQMFPKQLGGTLLFVNVDS